jgi:uncharacterized protein (TIGR03437 family)
LRLCAFALTFSPHQKNFPGDEFDSLFAPYLLRTYFWQEDKTVKSLLALLLAVAAFSTAAYAKPAKSGVEPAPPTASACLIAVSPGSHLSPGSGDTFPVTVTVLGPGCIYGVFSSPLWMDMTGVPTSSLSVTVQPNVGPLRTGSFTIKVLLHTGNTYEETGQQVVFQVTQPTGSCPYSFDKTVLNISGGTSILDGFLTVTTASSCPRNATSNVNWITVLSPPGFFGSGQIEYKVAQNFGPPRTGKITLGNATYTVNQGSGCSYDFSPTSKQFDAVGGSGAINVTCSDPGCPRDLTSNANWITIVGGNNATGNGPVTYTVAPNNGPARTGQITHSNTLTPFYITQAGGCGFTLSSSIFNFQPGNGVSSIHVTASSSQCPWSALSNAPWVKITSGANGTGSGTVAFTVEPNPGALRTTTITIANKTATINQFGNQPSVDCSFTINPGNYQFGVVGGEVVVNVTASKDSCKWYMGSMSPFISVITGGSGGLGNGTVKLKIQPNAGAARSGSAEIAGKTFSITQEGVNPQAMVIVDLSPGFTAAGGTDFFLTVKGANFASTCRVQWNGKERPTTFFNNSTLMATISANDIAGEGVFDVTVANNSNGAESNAENFLVYGALANVSSASFKGESLAPASLVSGFGGDLSKELKIANSQPLPTELAGTTVTVTDATGKEYDAQLFFVSEGQVNYLMPAGVALGKATVMITSGSGHTSLGTVEIAPVAPGLFSANSTGIGLASALALRVKANGQQVYEQTVQYDVATGVLTAKPIDLSVPGEQVYLILWGTGLRYRNSLGSVLLSLGGVASNVLYAGEAPGYPGLDQINVLAPTSLAGRGSVDLTLTVDGKKANTVKLTFK